MARVRGSIPLTFTHLLTKRLVYESLYYVAKLIGSNYRAAQRIRVNVPHRFGVRR